MISIQNDNFHKLLLFSWSQSCLKCFPFIFVFKTMFWILSSLILKCACTILVFYLVIYLLMYLNFQFSLTVFYCTVSFSASVSLLWPSPYFCCTW
jgi:hypothetical protein